MASLGGKVAIVTGGANGIGRSYCSRLAAEGTSVVVADVDEASARAASAAIQAAGGVVLALGTDVADEASVTRMARATVERFGRIDILVNNAAIFAPRAPFDQVTLEEWQRAMSVNVGGVFLCCKAVFPQMKERGWGRIINIASSTFWTGKEDHLHYVTAKGAVVGLTRQLAFEIGRYGITVNALAVGLTSTDRVTAWLGRDELERHAAQRSVKRQLTPEDLADAVVFLASEGSSMITGQVLNVDGGAVFH